MAADAHLDIFIVGDFTLNFVDNFVGNHTQPANVRLYAAASVTDNGVDNVFTGSIHASIATFSLNGDGSVAFGSIFCQAVTLNGPGKKRQLPLGAQRHLTDADSAPPLCEARVMVTAARFKKLALALEGASKVPHVDRVAYRTTRKIFATLAPGGRSANLLLSLEVQQAIVEAMPHAFAPVPGGWGRMGYTTVDLGSVAEVDLVRALAEAHAMAAPSPKAKTKSEAKPKTETKPGKRPRKATR